MEPKRPFVFQEVLRRAGRRDVNAGVGTRLPAVHYGREKGHHDTHVGRQVWGAQHLQSDQAIQHAIHKHRRTQLTQPPAKVIQRESPDTCGKTCAQAKANSHNRTPNLSETQPLLPNHFTTRACYDGNINVVECIRADSCTPTGGVLSEWTKAWRGPRQQIR